MAILLYDFFLFLYDCCLCIASPFNSKASFLVSGRKNWEASLEISLKKNKTPVIWMHCASLGEFEQGRPLLEYIRKQFPKYRIVLSFFSPSGYNIRKSYSGVDHVCYLPKDSSKNARKFLDIVNPEMVLWIRYDFWYHFLTQLNNRKIPVLLISGLFRGTEPFFQWYGKLHRIMLASFTMIFVQNESSSENLTNIGFTRILISGDTRYDRVSEIANQFLPIPLIENFLENNQGTIVAGSTWPEDEEELEHFANTNPETKLIIAPHEIKEVHLKEIERLFKHSIRFSQLQSIAGRNEKPAEPKNVLIIDNIGMLSKLYHYATIAYIGGGFGEDGLHNILEAAVYGVPVVHGPVYKRFPEAVGLLESGGSFTVANALELESVCKELLGRGELYEKAAAASKAFVKNKQGATAAIIGYIQANRLLTS